MTANLPRTASRVLANASISYLLDLADKGLEGVLGTNAGLAAVTYLYKGKVVNESLGKSLDVPVTPLAQLLPEGDSR
jgi:alanine dehydrogenase